MSPLPPIIPRSALSRAPYDKLMISSDEHRGHHSSLRENEHDVKKEAATKIQHAFRHARSMGFFSTIAKNHESLTKVADSPRNDSSKTF